MSSLGYLSTFLDDLYRCVTLSGWQVGILGLFTRVKMWVGTWAYSGAGGKLVRESLLLTLESLPPFDESFLFFV